MPEIVTEDGDVLCDDKQKADAFADYFEKKVHDITSNTTVQESYTMAEKRYLEAIRMIGFRRTRYLK